MKIAPASASGPARGLPRSTAPTRTPMATANAAGSPPLSNRANHHARARSGPGQDGEKPPFLAFEHPLEHARIVPEKPFLCINRWLKGVGVRVIWDFTGRVRLRNPARDAGRVRGSVPV